MDIEVYEPISTLKVEKNLIYKSKYPFVDVHNHQFDMPIKDLSKLVKEMDSLNMAYMVNLSGFRGIYLDKSLFYTKKITFNLNLNFDKLNHILWKLR